MFSLRATKTVSSVTTHYVYGLNGQLYGEYDNSGNLIREYVYLNGAPLAMIDDGSPEVVTYLHVDHLGTPKFGTNSGGTQVWSWAPDAFGIGSPSGSVTVNLRFPGQYHDAESGLHYNWNRYYNPAIGRYITSDPIGLAGGMNTFGYVAQNPVNWTDSQGLSKRGGNNGRRGSGGQNDHFGPVRAVQFQNIRESLRQIEPNNPQLTYVAPFNWTPRQENIKRLRDELHAAQRRAADRKLRESTKNCPAPDFVVTPKGEAIPVPTGATGPTPTRAPGFQYTGGSGGNGLNNRVDGVRIMDSNRNQGPRAVYMNRQGQTVNPNTGHTVSNSDTNAHHYLEPWQ